LKSLACAAVSGCILSTAECKKLVYLMPEGGGGVLPYMGHVGMCGPKGYDFSAVLVINRGSILTDFGHFGHN